MINGRLQAEGPVVCQQHTKSKRQETTGYHRLIIAKEHSKSVVYGIRGQHIKSKRSTIEKSWGHPGFLWPFLCYCVHAELWAVGPAVCQKQSFRKTAGSRIGSCAIAWLPIGFSRLKITDIGNPVASGYVSANMGDYQDVVPCYIWPCTYILTPSSG